MVLKSARKRQCARRLTAAALVALFAVACGAEKPEQPTRAGVSTALAYPVLLIGQSSLDVRDSEVALTSIRGDSSLNLNERVILDSQGRLFDVRKAGTIAGERSVLWDMGTSERRFFVEVTERDRPAWADIEALVLEQVRSPRSTWAGSERAIERMRQLHDVASLIEASRESWNWKD